MSTEHLVVDLYGHEFRPKTLQHLMDGHLRARKRWIENYPNKPFHPTERTRECCRCGRDIDFEWSGVDGEPMTLGMQSLPVHLWREEYVWEQAEDPKCPVPEYTPTKVRFICRSGRIAMGNDLREHLPKELVKEGHRIEIGSHAGRVAYIESYAKGGYLTNFVGNSHVWFLKPAGGIAGLDIHYPGHVDDEMVGDDGWNHLGKTAVHDVSAGLWWFGVMDAADLPEGAKDSSERDIGFIDLAPGEYEFTAMPETSGRRLWLHCGAWKIQLVLDV